jgi:predicted outer membrane protein
MPMAIFACMTAVALGQGAPAVKPQPAAQPGAATAQNAKNHQNASNELDQHAAACLLIGNQEEIALSQMALDKAHHDRVKDFANHMVKDHEKFIGKLRKFTPQNASFELNIKTDDSGNAKSVDDKSSNNAARAGETTVAKTGVAGHSMMDQLLAIKRDKAQECLALTRSELKNKQGHDFDMAFMGMQCAAHTSMLAELKALKKHTHGEFAELVADGEKTTQEHLDMAKNIIEDMKHDGAPAARTAREGRDDRGADRNDRIDRDRPAPPPRDERPLPPRRERP